MSWFLGRSTELRFEPGRPQGIIVDIPERDRHYLARAVDGDMAEELQPEARRQILSLLLAGRLHIDELRSERGVERIGAEGAGVDRSGYELPEWIEVLEGGLVGIIIMRGGVMHVGGKPERVANAGMLDEAKQVGNLQLAAARRPVFALGDSLDAPVAIDVIDHEQADRHVGRDHL